MFYIYGSLKIALGLQQWAWCPESGIKCCGGLCCFLLGSIDGDGGGERGDDVEGAGDEHGSLKIALSLVKFTCAVLPLGCLISQFPRWVLFEYRSCSAD